ncbi:MAG: gamma-glutamyltransferase, partial [Bryobacteraceae bacterium]
MMRRITVFLFCFALAAFGQGKPHERPLREAVRGTRGAVAGGSEWATVAGMRLYYQGGNAVDAGLAAMFAASVSEFSHFGFGGEAPILIRTKAGKVYAVAGVGTMPKLATAEMFRTRALKPFEVMQIDPGGIKGIIPVAGIMPALVPGMVDAGLVALKNFGTKSFAEVAESAVELTEGLAIDSMRSGSIARSRRFLDVWPDSKRHFMPDGHIPLPGQIFRQP